MVVVKEHEIKCVKNTELDQIPAKIFDELIINGLLLFTIYVTCIIILQQWLLSTFVMIPKKSNPG